VLCYPVMSTTSSVSEAALGEVRGSADRDWEPPLQLAISVGSAIAKACRTPNLPASALSDLEEILREALGGMDGPEERGHLEDRISKLIDEGLWEQDIDIGDAVGELDARQKIQERVRDLKTYLTSVVRSRIGATRNERAERKRLRTVLWTDQYSVFAVSMPSSFLDRYVAALVIRSRECAAREEERKTETSPCVAATPRIVSRAPFTVTLAPSNSTKGISPATTAGDGPPLTENALEKIRKAVASAKAPPNGPIRAFYSDIAETRGWTAIHEFYWLHLHTDERLWMQIKKARGRLLENPLSRDSYRVAVSFVWNSLDRRFGRSRELEQLQHEYLQMAQRPSEQTLAYLGRVGDFKSRCETAGIVQKDEYWITLARAGLRDALTKRLSYITVPNPLSSNAVEDSAALTEWEEWIISMEQFAGMPVTGSTEVCAAGARSSSEGQSRSQFRGKCFACQKPGHKRADCPWRKKGAASTTQPPTPPKGAAAGDETQSGSGIAEGQEARCSPGGHQSAEGPRSGEQSDGGKMTVKTSTFAVEAVACLSADLGAAGQGGGSSTSLALGEEDSMPSLSVKFGEITCEALLDTGRARSRGPRLGVDNGVQIKVRYADNREELVIGEVVVAAEINGAQAYLPCLIVRSLGRMIVGRRGLSLLGAELTFAQSPQAERDHLRKVFHEGKGISLPTVPEITPVPDTDPDCASISIECCHTNGELYVQDDPEAESAGSRNKFEERRCRDVLERRVEAVLKAAEGHHAKAARTVAAEGRKGLSRADPEAEKEILSELLDGVVGIGGLKVADGYELKLVEAPGSGDWDDELQQYRFVASWKLKPAETPTGRTWNSSRLIEQLSPAERAEFREHCDFYLGKSHRR
ncbi:hypothetical protein FOZ60_008144, partial [Perkinsus olseni]